MWILENKKVFLLNLELGVCNYTLATQFVGYFGWKYRPENVEYDEVENTSPKVLRFTYKKLDKDGNKIQVGS